MVAMFIGKRVSIGKNVRIGYGAKLYGSTVVGDNTIIDGSVVIGYPTRYKVINIVRSMQSREQLDEQYDNVSDGANVGRECVIRSGTVVYERVTLGDRVEIGHNVLIREESYIDCNSRIGSSSIIDGKVVIGSNTNIQSGVYIPPGVRIGSNVFIGPRVVFTNDRYPPSSRIAEIVIEDDVIIGANAIIVAGVKVGRGAVIAAGAVVTRSVEPYTVVAGVPAKKIMLRDEYDKRRALYEAHYSFPYR